LVPSVANGYLGYNFAAPILGSVIPQRLQNLCIRDYAKQKGLTLSFTASEYFDHRPALMLFAQFNHGEAVSGFIFYSLTLLPRDPALRARFFSLCERHRLEVRFALEDLQMGDDPRGIDRLYQIRVDPRLDQTREALLRLRGR
jgi:sporadic carbohydrate cluster protein (TIGR04323 family)